MTDKDQFTFDDEDFPEANLDDQDESLEPELSDDELPGTHPGDQDESQKLALSDDDFLETPLVDQGESQESELNGEDFPETDLSAAFLEGEHAAEEPVPDEPEMNIGSGGNSRTRMLLVVLLLVVVGGAGAYYFMDLGGTTPSVSTVPAPPQTHTKSVDLPPQSTQAPADQAKAETAAPPVSVTVPPPPQPAEPVAQDAPVSQPAAEVSPAAVPGAEPGEQMVAEKPQTGPVDQPAAQVAAEPLSPPAHSAEPGVQATGGAFALDAGSYLLESNRDSLVTKIRKLGYEPLITPLNATLNMTRLRIGTFSKDEVQEALDFARSIEPGAYSSPAGDQYVIYAGTFLKSNNAEKLSQRFLKEGIKIYPEPVQVVRTLSRIRFGSFATKEDAVTAAKAADDAGLKAVVVKSK